MNKITITSLLFLFSAIVAVPKAIAQTPENPDNTRIEKYEDLTQSDVEPMDSESNMDNMDTEPMDTEPMDTEPMDTEPIDSEPMDSEPMDSQEDMEQLDTRTEETIQEVQPGDMNTNSMYDVRRTEAFNLVSSAYRGDFEEQGINSYAVLIENYQTRRFNC